MSGASRENYLTVQVTAITERFEAAIREMEERWATWGRRIDPGTRWVAEQSILGRFCAPTPAEKVSEEIADWPMTADAEVRPFEAVLREIVKNAKEQG